MRVRFILLAALAIAPSIIRAGSAGPAHADAIVVTTTADSGPGSLRAAILAANANPGLDTITFDSAEFPAGNPAVISPTSELPDIDATEGITIDGSGAGVVLDGSGAGVAGGLEIGPYNAGIRDITVRNITIQDFYWENLQVDSTVSISGLTLVDFQSIGSGDEGIEVSGGDLTGAVFERLSITGSDYEGLEVVAGTIEDLVILDSEIVSPLEDGVQIDGNAIRDVEIRGNTITDADDEAISVSGDGEISNVVIAGNTVTSSKREAAQVVPYSGGTFGGVVIEDNTFSSSDTAGGATVELFGPAHSRSFVRNNVIAGGGGDGVAITNGARLVTISRNSISGNDGIGIDLRGAGEFPSVVTPNDPGDGDSGPNDFLNFPEILSMPGSNLAGTACGGCTVEVFLSGGDQSGYGEGVTFLVETTADGGGQWQVGLCDLAAGAGVTTTATDPAGNTSEFSANFTLPADADPCTPPGETRKWGDGDCDDDVDSVDALKGLRHVAALTIQQTEPCPDIGDMVDVSNASPHKWGDVDCDDDVDSVDALKILRHVAALPVSQTEPCPDVGSLVLLE